MIKNILYSDFYIQNILSIYSNDLRTLQSIAFHLHLHSSFDINISRIDANDIIQFSETRRLIHDHLLANKSLLDNENFRKMIEFRKIELFHFEFLKGYSKKYIFNKIADWNIHNDDLLINCLRTNQSIEITVGYILDNALYPAKFLTKKLETWKKGLEQMKGLATRAKWFDSSEKVEAAKYIFSKNRQAKYLNAFLHHSEIFFLDEKINSHEKELIFQEIRARHNLVESRRTNPKKQCNFSLNPNAYKLMEKLRKKSKLKKSEFIELIFSPEHESILQRFIDLKKLPPDIDSLQVPPRFE